MARNQIYLHPLACLIGLLLFLSCNDQKSAYPAYTLTAEQSGYFGRNDQFDEFGLILRLKPERASLKPFYLMTCSWVDFAAGDNDSIVLGTGCDSNYLVSVSLKEDEFLELFTTAHCKKGLKVNSARLRVGLIPIDTSELDFSFYLFDPSWERCLDSLKAQRERYIWSNEITLKRLEKSEELSFGKWEVKKIH